jgi:hypothetical protein
MFHIPSALGSLHFEGMLAMIGSCPAIYRVHMLTIPDREAVELRFVAALGDGSVRGAAAWAVVSGQTFAGDASEDLLALANGTHDMTLPKLAFDAEPALLS